MDVNIWWVLVGGLVGALATAVVYGLTLSSLVRQNETLTSLANGYGAMLDKSLEVSRVWEARALEAEALVARWSSLAHVHGFN